MAALQCEICGGKLMGRPGGIFECDSCGMEYDTAWAKAKIQEIKGTVKVEGIVQVAGTVKVEGGISVDSMLQRGFMELKKRNWKEAANYFERALDIQPECSKAYLGKLMGYANCQYLAELESIYIGNTKLERYSSWSRKDIIEHPYFLDMKRFADAEIKQMLSQWDQEYWMQLGTDLEQRKEGASQREALRRTNATMPQLVFPGYRNESFLLPDGSILSDAKQYGNTSRWEDIVQVLHVFFKENSCFTLGLKQDGTVMATTNMPSAFAEVKTWKHIRQLYFFARCVFGLDESGAVLVAGEVEQTSIFWDTCIWSGIRKLAGNTDCVIGIREDDTVVCIAKDKDLQDRVSAWTQIQDVSGSSFNLIGLKKDGSVYAEGSVIGCKGFLSTVSHWSGVAAVYNDAYGVMGICHDGTVLCEPENKRVSTWRNVADGAVMYGTPIGITPDGKVLSGGTISIHKNYKNSLSVEGWDNIQKIYVSSRRIIGLRKDGYIQIAQSMDDELSDINLYDLRLFRSLETLEQDRQAAQKERKINAARKMQAKAASLKKEQAELSRELQSLRGIFTAKRRKEIEARLEEIQTELKGLR